MLEEAIQILRPDLPEPGAFTDDARTCTGLTYGELCDLDLPPLEYLMPGLPRGYTALLVAPSNAGKSTLLRNLFISLCVGRSFLPLLSKGPLRRVCLIDGEDTIEMLRNDLKRTASVLSQHERELFRQNSIIYCEAGLRLSEPGECVELFKRLERFKPDVIIVDTISSLFIVKDENSNAEMKNVVALPLGNLAKRFRAGVISAHHVGRPKVDGGSTSNVMMRARGASSLIDQSKIIIYLSKHASGDGSVVVECGKSKTGEPAFPRTILRLDPSKRWFHAVGQIEHKPRVQVVLDGLVEGKVYSVADIFASHPHIPKRTQQDHLKRLVEGGYLKRLKRDRYEKVQ